MFAVQKNWTSVLVLSLALQGCLPDQNNKSTQAQPAAPKVNLAQQEQHTEGGISSGGGGTFPEEPATVDGVAEHAGDARINLNYYFKYLQLIHLGDGSDKPTYLKLLFDGPETIFDILDTRVIEIEEKKPCYDANKNEVDGSVHGSSSISFCISAYRIAPKVTKYTAFKEVTALVAHELSHFLGADEKIAREIQKDIIHKFNEKYVNETSMEAYVKRSVHYWHDTTRAFESFLDENDHVHDTPEKRMVDAYQQFKVIDAEGNPYLNFGPGYYYGFQHDHVFYMFTDESAEQHNYFQDQLTALKFYFCTQVEMDPEEKSDCQFFLNKAFEGQLSIPWKKINPQASSYWADEPILRITNNEEAASIMKKLGYYFGFVTFVTWPYYPNYINSHLFSQKFWNRFDYNPWSAYLGKYKVINQTCTSENALPDDEKPLLVTEISIEPYNNESSGLLLFEKTPEKTIKSFLISSGMYFGERSGDEDLDKQETTYLYEKNGSAKRQIGDADKMWSDFQIDSIEKKESYYELSRQVSYANRNQTTYEFEARVVHYCTYQLQKMD